MAEQVICEQVVQISKICSLVGQESAIGFSAPGFRGDLALKLPQAIFVKKNQKIALVMEHDGNVARIKLVCHTKDEDTPTVEELQEMADISAKLSTYLVGLLAASWGKTMSEAALLAAQLATREYAEVEPVLATIAEHSAKMGR